MNDTEIVRDFLKESKALIEIMTDQLESVEVDITDFKLLAEFGNNVDRIMGGAKSLAMMYPQNVALTKISDFSALCKAVGYKASNSRNNESLISTSVALLLDAVEALELLLDNLDASDEELREFIPKEFLERLKWVSDQFEDNISASVDAGNVDKSQEITALLKKLGL